MQLGSKDGHLPFSKILNHTSFQKILEVLHSRMHTAKRRPRRNDKNKATREVFEISNHYVPDSCMTVSTIPIRYFVFANLLVVFILFASNIQGAFKNSLFYIVMDIKALSVICKMLYKYMKCNMDFTLHSDKIERHITFI